MSPNFTDSNRSRFARTLAPEANRDAGFLAGFSNLRELDLTGTDVGGNLPGSPNLAGLKNLRNPLQATG